MQLDKRHLTGLRGAVFYDPWHKHDRRHAEWILAKAPGLQRVSCPASNHRTIKVFTESGRSSVLLHSIQVAATGADQLVVYKSIYRESRRTSATYLLGMSSILRRKSKHSRAHWSIRYDLEACRTANDLAAQLRIASHFVAAGDTLQADEWIGKAEQHPKKQSSLAPLARLHEKRGRIDEAIAHYHIHCGRYLGDIDSVCRLATLLANGDHVQQAIAVLSKANVRLSPTLTSATLVRYARLKSRLQGAVEALAVLQQHEERFGEAPEFQRELEAQKNKVAKAAIGNVPLCAGQPVVQVISKRSAVTNDPTLVFKVPSGHFFLQNDSCDVMGQHQRKVVFSDAVIAHWQHLLAERGRWLGQKNIPYYFLIAPDKQTVYWDELAKDVPDYRNALKIFEGPFENVSVIDPSQALIEARSGGDVYPHTDSHWDARGAYVAYCALMQAIKGEDVTLLAPGTHFQWMPHDSAGDLGCKLSPPVVSAHYRLRRQAMHAKAVFDNGMPANGRMRLWINPAAVGKCLFFGDSFSYPIAQYLAEHFGLLLHVHGTHFDANLVSEFEPDQVVSEVTERFMVSAPMIEDHEPTELIYLRKMKRGDVAPEQIRQMRLTPRLDGLAAAACAPLYRRDQLILGAYCDRNVPPADYGTLDFSRAADVLAVAAHAQIARQVLPLAWQQCANDLNAVARDIVAGIGPRQ